MPVTPVFINKARRGRALRCRRRYRQQTPLHLSPDVQCCHHKVVPPPPHIDETSEGNSFCRRPWCWRTFVYHQSKQRVTRNPAVPLIDTSRLFDNNVYGRAERSCFCSESVFGYEPPITINEARRLATRRLYSSPKTKFKRFGFLEAWGGHSQKHG